MVCSEAKTCGRSCTEGHSFEGRKALQRNTRQFLHSRVTERLPRVWWVMGRCCEMPAMALRVGHLAEKEVTDADGQNARPATAPRVKDVPDGQAHLLGFASTTVSDKKDEFGRVETIALSVSMFLDAGGACVVRFDGKPFPPDGSALVFLGV